MESLFYEYKQIYMYSLDKDNKVKERVIHRYKSTILGFCWKDDRGRILHITNSDVDTFKNNRVVLTSPDIKKAKEIISKSLFKKMLKAQEAYNRANDKFIKFREVNG